MELKELLMLQSMQGASNGKIDNMYQMFISVGFVIIVQYFDKFYNIFSNYISSYINKKIQQVEKEISFVKEEVYSFEYKPDNYFVNIRYTEPVDKSKEELTKNKVYLDALFHHVNKLYNIPETEMRKNDFLPSCLNKDIQITDDVFMKVKDIYDTIQVVLFSKTKTVPEILLFLDELIVIYNKDKTNELDKYQQIFTIHSKKSITSFDPRGDIYVNNKVSKREELMREPPKLTFKSSRFNSNKYPQNVLGDQCKLVFDRIKFFQTNKAWYKDKGVPYHITFMLSGNPGSGKCHGIDTPIIMFDGTIKMVQDIEVGDIIMGDDSTPRKVMALGRGRDIMYKITNVKGESYVVNSEHILCLKYSVNKFISHDKKCKRFRVKWFDNKQIKIKSKEFYYGTKDKDIALKEASRYLNNIQEEKICEISVNDYLKLPNWIKSRLKGYFVPLDFPEKELEFDPYIIGLWLGDGTSSKSEITNQDASILKYLSSTLYKYDCYLQYNRDAVQGYKYRINGNKYGKNNFIRVLRKYNLLNNKHIPLQFKCNSRENRLKLLAGLIDSDGWLDDTKYGYEFCQSLEHERLFDDVVYLAKSLGFACYKKQKNTSWTYKGIKKYCKALRMYISGEGLEDIPILCTRKKSNQRRQIKDVLVSGIDIEKIGEDNYYGFELDCNHRYVLGNFIVTHNTSSIKAVANELKRHLFVIRCNEIKTSKQFHDLFTNETIQLITDPNTNQVKTVNIPIEKRIYVLEELDILGSILLDRNIIEQKEDSDSVNDEELTLDDFLNVLDGNNEYPGRVIFITSNHVDKFDKALLRGGRIDCFVNFVYPQREDIVKYIEFFKDISLTEEQKSKINRQISYADMCQLLISYNTVDEVIKQLS